MKLKITKTGMNVLYLTLIGAFLRLLWAWGPELFSDENVYAMWSQNWDFMMAYAHTLLHAIWISISFAMFGVGDIQSRIPSIFFGALIIPVYYLLGKHLYNKKTGFLAAFVATFNIFLIANSRFAYNEMCLMFMMLLSIFFFVRSLDNPKYFIPTAAAIALSIMTKNNALYLLPLFGLFYIWEKGWKFYNEKDFMKYFLAAIVTLLLFIYPYFYHFALFKQVMGFKTLWEGYDSAIIMGRGSHILNMPGQLLRFANVLVQSTNPLVLALTIYGSYLAFIRKKRADKFVLFSLFFFLIMNSAFGRPNADMTFAIESIKKAISVGIPRVDLGIIEMRYFTPAYLMFPLLAALAIKSIKQIKKEYLLAGVVLLALPYLFQIYAPTQIDEGLGGYRPLQEYAEDHPGIFVSDDDICWPQKRWYLRNVQHVYLSDFGKLPEKPTQFYYIMRLDEEIGAAYCPTDTDAEFEALLLAQLQPITQIDADGTKLFDIYAVTIQQDSV